MTTPHRTLQMALDALDAITDDVDGTGLNTMPSFDKALDAIAALREALNAPEPEPYGHVTTHTVTGQQFFYRYPSPPYLDTAKECIAVYAAPPAAPAPAAPVVPDLKHCACEFDGDTCVTQCKLHAAHVDAIHEWAERAKAAEAKLSAAPVVREPLTIDQEKALSAEAKTGPFQHTTPVVGNDMQSGETLRLSSKRHAGSTPPAAPIPDGMVMVPREPTEEMIQAAAGAWGESESGLHNAFAAALRGGIAAAPAAPVVPLTDEQLAKIAVEDEFLLYCDQDSFNEIARAIEAAHGITGASK